MEWWLKGDTVNKFKQKRGPQKRFQKFLVVRYDIFIPVGDHQNSGEDFEFGHVGLSRGGSREGAFENKTSKA